MSINYGDVFPYTSGQSFADELNSRFVSIKTAINAAAGADPNTVKYRGAWTAATAIKKYDIVSQSGGKWLALNDSLNSAPVEGADWTAMGGGVTIAKATTSVYGIVKLSAAPTDATQPIAVSATQNVGGVLSGNILNPGFAVDMATQAELDNAIATRAPTIHTQAASTITDFSQAVRESMEYATGAPVQTLAELRAVAAANRQDKQQRLVEDAGVNYRFDLQGTGADDADGIITPTTGAGRWFKSSASASATGNADTLGGQNAGYYLARANHSGTQSIATIDDLQTELDAKTETIFVDTEADIPPNLAPGTVVVVANSTEATAGIPYDIALFVASKPSAGATVFAHDVARAFSFAANFAGSRASSGAASQGACAFSVRKNGVEIGTVSFAAGASVGTFAGAAIQFVIGDLLEIVSPATADATLANVRLSLKGVAI